MQLAPSTSAERTPAPETTAASSDVTAWHRYGGRHDLACWLSKTFAREDGSQSGRCYCGLACEACRRSYNEAVRLGLYPDRSGTAGVVDEGA